MKPPASPLLVRWRDSKAATLFLDLFFRSVISCVMSNKFKLLVEVFAYLLRGSFQAHDLYLVLWTEFSDWNDNGLSQFHNTSPSVENVHFPL